MNKVLNVRCPHCGTKFSYYESKFRPFCTERCRMVDLGHWLEESYRIPEKSKEIVKIEDTMTNNSFDPDLMDEESDEFFDYTENDEEQNGENYDQEGWNESQEDHRQQKKYKKNTGPDSEGNGSSEYH